MVATLDVFGGEIVMDKIEHDYVVSSQFPHSFDGVAMFISSMLNDGTSLQEKIYEIHEEEIREDVSEQVGSYLQDEEDNLGDYLYQQWKDNRRGK